MKKRLEKLFTVMLIISVMMSMMSVPAFASEDVKACTMAAHHHTDDCYTSTLICEETQDLVCSIAAHVHSVEEGCYHVHDSGCYLHSDSCYDGYTCGKTAGEVDCDVDHHVEMGCPAGCVENHHTAECKVHSHDSCVKNLVCPGLPDELNCGMTEEALEANLECEKPEHTHANTDSQTCFVTHEHKEGCYKKELICLLPEHDHVAECDNAVALIGTTPYTSLAAAVTAANAISGSEVPVIKLVADTTFDSAMTVTRDMEITGAHTVTRADSYTKTMFVVNAGAELILDDLIIDGGNNWTLNEDYYTYVKDGICGNAVDDSTVKYAASEPGGPVASDYLIKVNGSLTAYDATIQNNFGYSLINVGANGVLVTEGAVITHNSKSGGGLIATLADGAKWTIEDGTEICYNHADGGFGVLTEMRKDCDLIINGGKIYENSSVDVNGVLVATYSKTAYIEINGGDMYHNWALYGNNNNWNSLFYLNAKMPGAKLVMNGGHIHENYASYVAGISTNGDGVIVELNGGIIEDGISGVKYTGADSVFGSPLDVTGDVILANARVLNHVDVEEGVTLDVDTLYVNGAWYNINFTGKGTVSGNIQIYNGNTATLESGTWTDGLVTVDSVEKVTGLSVKAGAVIDGKGVHVMASVPTGNYKNAEESAAAQKAAYTEEEGAVVAGPVLYYHRLKEAQKDAVVVTYDYNGGLDAQGWSGVQMTGASPLIHEHPAPTKEGYKLVGWTLEGADYTADSAAESITLVAKWDSAYVAKIVETGKLYETLAAAVADANTLDGANTVEMLKSIDFDGNAALSVDGDLTIIGEYTISRGSYTGTLFTVPAGSSLTLDGGITFDGSNNWTFNKKLYEADLYARNANKGWQTYVTPEEGGTISTAPMFVVNGSMNANNTTIQNCFNNKGNSNSGVYAIFQINSGATLTTDGATITRVAANSCSTVVGLNSGSWYIKGETLISENYAGRNGGITRDNNGQIYMSGGTIKNNYGYNTNGTVFMMYGTGSAFYMTGGTICGNSSLAGIDNGRCAAVYLHDNSYMKMTGGTICHNIGGARGGIDNKGVKSSLDINRVDQEFDNSEWKENGTAAYTATNHPQVVDNVSLSNSPQNDVGHGGSYKTWWVTGGIYTQDVDDFCAAGYVCIPYADSERTDDYIVVPGYRVKYHSVEKVVTKDDATGEDTTEYKTTLVNKYFHLLPRGKFWYEMNEHADNYRFENAEGKVIDTWYTEKEMTNKYDFSTKLEGDLDVYGAWGEDKTPENNNPPIYIGPIVTPTPEPKPEPTPVPPLVEVEDQEVPLAPEVEIEEPDVPLAEPEVEVEEEEIPLTDVPKTADTSNLMLWLTMAALSAMALLTMKLTEKKEY